MITFHSMTEVTVWIVITVFFLLLVTSRTNPFSAAGQFVQDMFTSRKYLIHFSIMIGILVINKVELWVETRLPKTTDFTPAIYGLEGDFVAGLQTLLQHTGLTSFSVFFYVVVFPSIIITSILYYTHQRAYTLFFAVCYTLMFNYMIAIPFYLFFPVTEVWAYHPNVNFLMTSVFPNFETEYRPLSGLDNCIPSLHTSISVSMAMIARRSDSVFWKRFTIFSSGVIIFSIFYLGIHWLTDMAAGLVLGLLASHLALRISEGRLSGQLIGTPFKGNNISK